MRNVSDKIERVQRIIESRVGDDFAGAHYLPDDVLVALWNGLLLKRQIEIEAAKLAVTTPPTMADETLPAPPKLSRQTGDVKPPAPRRGRPRRTTTDDTGPK